MNCHRFLGVLVAGLAIGLGAGRADAGITYSVSIPVPFNNSNYPDPLKPGETIYSSPNSINLNTTPMGGLLGSGTVINAVNIFAAPTGNAVADFYNTMSNYLLRIGIVLTLTDTDNKTTGTFNLDTDFSGKVGYHEVFSTDNQDFDQYIGLKINLTKNEASSTPPQEIIFGGTKVKVSVLGLAPIVYQTDADGTNIGATTALLVSIDGIATPEPTTMAGAVLGLGVLALYRRRLRRSA